MHTISVVLAALNEAKDLNRLPSALIEQSLLHARAGSHNVYKERDRLPAIRIDVDKFQNTLAMREQLDSDLKRFIDDFHQPSLNVFYEDILLDEPGTLQRVYEFIGVVPRKTKEVSFKNTDDDLRRALLNFDEFKAAVSETPYEEMFDEVLVKESLC